jgi:hypothetical protein
LPHSRPQGSSRPIAFRSFDQRPWQGDYREGFAYWILQFALGFAAAEKGVKTELRSFCKLGANHGLNLRQFQPGVFPG